MSHFNQFLLLDDFQCFAKTEMTWMNEKSALESFGVSQQTSLRGTMRERVCARFPHIIGGKRAQK